MATARLLKEWQSAQAEARRRKARSSTSSSSSASSSSSSELYDQITLEPQGDTLQDWSATISGPPETPYEGGVFLLSIRVPDEYPLQPPKVRFVTPVFHPNVHFKTGEICLDILKTAWSPILTLQTVCRSIVALLANPEPNSPLNCDCGNLLRCGDVRGYRSMARMYTRLLAMNTNQH